LQNVCYGFVGAFQANIITQPIISTLLKSSVISLWKVLRKKTSSLKIKTKKIIEISEKKEEV
jgi:hypothetical protein